MAIWIPVACLRGRDDCISLAQIQSDCGNSFWCCGRNSPENREVPQDRFRLCFKNSVVDEMSDNDETDLHDLLSVVSQALSADLHMEKEDAG